ncbi:choice-of-anchor P family protein [Actinopolymorpha sp. B17G11]|uniref:choice-of-anchor P family protein n=1 Tax=Actinopolymorpha sp. B17G11 TaxID=3160861 RepID=UPI0032E3FA56
MAQRQFATGSSAAAAPAEGNGRCDVAVPGKFTCELLFFHESSPGLTSQSDVAVLTWRFEDRDGGLRAGEGNRGGPPDDVAAIDFGNYNEKCYGVPLTSQAAWDYFPGRKRGGLVPAKDTSRLVTQTGVSAETNATAWRVKDESLEGGIPADQTPNAPKTFVGYVEVTLPHRIGEARREAKCAEDFEEIRAHGLYTHFEDGDGDWNGVSVGAGFGPLTVNFAPESDPGLQIPASSGILGLHGPSLGGGQVTRINYTGPTNIRFNEPFTASARLTTTSEGTAQTTGARPAALVQADEPSVPVGNAAIQFSLGLGGGLQTCRDTTNSSGVASCVLTPRQHAGPTTLTVRYLGGGGNAASNSFVAFTVTHQFTEVVYTGPKRIANGTPAHVSGVLRERGGPPIGGRRLQLALGTGSNRRTCTGTTDSSGTARCTIRSVDQPLNQDATVPASVAFAGDQFYLASSTSDTVLLEFYTGRSYGLAAQAGVAGVVDADVPPTPDTGKVRVARAMETTTGCTARLSALLLGAEAVCPQVETSLAPGTSRATTTVEHATIGLPGLPMVVVDGATARSTSSCGSGGSATGTTDLRLHIGGNLVEVTGEANAVVDLPGVAKLVVNEQVPVAKADHGLTVNAVHLIATGGTDIVLASATSDVHNCAS